MRFAASSSTHPVAAAGLGECLGELLERGGTDPDVVVVAVAGPHRHFVGEVLAGVSRLLRPRLVLGAVTEGVMAGSGDTGTGLAFLAGWEVDVEPLSPLSDLVAEEEAPGVPVDLVFATDADLLPEDDPFGPPSTTAAQRVGVVVPGRSGGVFDGREHRAGLVGVRFRDAGVRAFTHRSTETIGAELTVTASTVDDRGRNLVLTLAGERATEPLQAAIEARRAQEGPAPMMPPVLAATDPVPGARPGDALLVDVVGWDLGRGVLQTERPIPVGAAVEFRLPARRPDQLRSVAARTGADAAFAAAVPGPDPETVPAILGALEDAWSRPQVAGATGDVVVGPVGGRNLRHRNGVAVIAFGTAPSGVPGRRE